MDFLNHISPGETFSGVYLVDSATEKSASNGSKYLEVFLRDKSGARKAICFKGYATGLSNGMFVQVSGRCTVYKDTPSLVADSIEKCASPDDLSNIVSSFDRELVDFEWNFLNGEIEIIHKSVGDAEEFSVVRAAVEEVYGNMVLKDRFLSPAGRNPHYGKVGGFVVATYDIYGLAYSAIQSYGLSEREGAVMKYASLVCRCGSVFAYTFHNAMPAYTFNGEMVGEAMLTMMMVNKALQTARQKFANEGVSYPEELVTRFMHCVLSYNGIVKPKTREALALKSIGDAHSGAIDCFDFIDGDTTQGRFTAYDPVHGSRYLKEF